MDEAPRVWMDGRLEPLTEEARQEMLREASENFEQFNPPIPPDPPRPFSPQERRRIASDDRRQVWDLNIDPLLAFAICIAILLLGFVHLAFWWLFVVVGGFFLKEWMQAKVRL